MKAKPEHLHFLRELSCLCDRFRASMRNCRVSFYSDDSPTTTEYQLSFVSNHDARGELLPDTPSDAVFVPGTLIHPSSDDPCIECGESPAESGTVHIQCSSCEHTVCWLHCFTAHECWDEEADEVKAVYQDGAAEAYLEEHGRGPTLGMNSQQQKEDYERGVV